MWFFRGDGVSIASIKDVSEKDYLDWQKSMRYLFLVFALLVSIEIMSQDSQDPAEVLPYAEIPKYPDSFTANTVAARMIDGLGFRYYWATEGLRPEDLEYKPSEDARKTSETIDHLLGLCNVINNAVNKRPNNSPPDYDLPFEEKRAKTLMLIKEASDILKAADNGEMEEFVVIFQRGESTSEYPFWNLINGPIADALWHCGQVVSFRRASGNPFNSKASVFTGKLRK